MSYGTIRAVMTSERPKSQICLVPQNIARDAPVRAFEVENEGIPCFFISKRVLFETQLGRKRKRRPMGRRS